MVHSQCVCVFVSAAICQLSGYCFTLYVFLAWHRSSNECVYTLYRCNKILCWQSSYYKFEIYLGCSITVPDVTSSVASVTAHVLICSLLANRTSRKWLMWFRCFIGLILNQAHCPSFLFLLLLAVAHPFLVLFIYIPASKLKAELSNPEENTQYNWWYFFI